MRIAAPPRKLEFGNAQPDGGQIGRPNGWIAIRNGMIKRMRNPVALVRPPAATLIAAPGAGVAGRCRVAAGGFESDISIS